MRWILLTSIIFLGFFLILGKNLSTNERALMPAIAPAPTPQPSKIIDLVYKGVTYRVNIIEVAETETTTLFLNLKEKLTLSQAKEKQSCRAVVNGGFYNKSDTPIGFFRVNGETIQPATKNSLFNGYITIINNSFSISGNLIESDSGLQSGPLLIVDQTVLPLRIREDEHARRMVAAKTAAAGLVFLSLYDPASTFAGPLLADLPDVLRAWSNQTGTTITDAINLDGGSASGMISDSVNLGELTHAGSFFCIK